GGFHITHGRPLLVANCREKGGVGIRIVAGRRAFEVQRAVASPRRNQWNDDEGADTVGEQKILCRVVTIRRQVLPHKRTLILKNPARMAFVNAPFQPYKIEALLAGALDNE